MSTEQNKAVVRRFIDQVLNKQDVASLDELFAPDYVNHAIPGGREGMRQVFTMLPAAFPNLKQEFRLEHLLAEGDYVVARITYHFSNGGKQATESGLSEYRVVDGKIVEDWPPSGTLALLQQVGVSLPPG